MVPKLASSPPTLARTAAMRCGASDGVPCVVVLHAQAEPLVPRAPVLPSSWPRVNAAVTRSVPASPSAIARRSMLRRRPGRSDGVASGGAPESASVLKYATPSLAPATGDLVCAEARAVHAHEPRVEDVHAEAPVVPLAEPQLEVICAAEADALDVDLLELRAPPRRQCPDAVGSPSPSRDRSRRAR